jgi:regulatory factor X
VLDESVHAGMTNGGSGSNNESRYSSLDAEFGPDQSFMSTTSTGMQDNSNANEGMRHNVAFWPA